MSHPTSRSTSSAPLPVALLAALALAATSPAAAAEPAYVSHLGLDPSHAANGESRHVTSRRLVSADGRWIAFASRATDLWGGVTDNNGTWDTFVEDRENGLTILVSHQAQVPGVAANGESLPRAISADGRFVAFSSLATDLVTGITDLNGASDAFVWDRNTGQIVLLSRSWVDLSKTANLASYPSRISADGAWVLLRSSATDLDAGTVSDSNGAEDVFLWERASGLLRLVSHVPSSDPGVYATGNGVSSPQTMSSDGRWVAFISSATDLLNGLADANAANDVYLWDRDNDATTLVSHAFDGALTAASGASGLAFSMSADGRFLAYQSTADNLILGTGAPWADVFLFDRQSGTNVLVSRGFANPAAEANGASEPQAISADGRHVLLSSAATDLIGGFVDRNGAEVDAYDWERQTGVMSLLSHLPAQTTTGGDGRSLPRLISADGRFVAIESAASDLSAAPGDDNGVADAYLWDRQVGESFLLSVTLGPSPAAGNGASMPWGMSADGAYLTVETLATDLVEGSTDENGTWDVVRFLNPRAPLFADGFESAGTGTWSAVSGGA